MVFPPNTPPPGGGEDETLENASPHFPGSCCDPGDVLCYWNLTQDPDPVEYTSLSPHDDSPLAGLDFSLTQKMLMNGRNGNLIGKDYNPLLEGMQDTLFPDEEYDLGFSADPAFEFLQDAVDIGNDLSDAWEDSYFGGTDDGKAIVKGVGNLVVDGVSFKNIFGELVDAAPVQDFVGRVSDKTNDWVRDKFGASGASVGASVGLSRIPLNDVVTLNFAAYYRRRQCKTLKTLFDNTWWQVDANISSGYWVNLQAVVPVDDELDKFFEANAGFDVRASLKFPGLFGDPSLYVSAPLAGWDSTNGFVVPGSLNVGFTLFNVSF